MVQSKEISFTLSDSDVPLYAKEWFPDDKPIIGLLQIVHGLNDRIERYSKFANYMASKGWLVFGEDHLGQGRSVKRVRYLGYTAPENGWKKMSEAVYILGRQIWEENPNLKWFAMGHSMGSLLLRTCLIDHPEAFDGVILLGSTGHSISMLKKLISRCKQDKLELGEKARSKELAEIVYGPEFLDFNPSTDTAMNEGKVDILCSYLPTIQLFEDFFTGAIYTQMGEISGYAHAQIPVLLLSGADDPTNHHGQETMVLSERLKAIGFDDVEAELIPGMRHELINMPNSSPVWHRIRDWLYYYNTEDKSEKSTVLE